MFSNLSNVTDICFIAFIVSIGIHGYIFQYIIKTNWRKSVCGEGSVCVSQLRDEEGEGRAGRCSHSIFTTVIINQKTFSFVLMGELMGSEIE